MIKAKNSIQAEEVLLQNKHVLFVEGKDNDAIDPEVLRELVDNNLRIEALGASFSVKSVAEALYPHHPSYYFLIDRDHQDDTFVDTCWANFPDPATHNLLVWKRREIENYFLEPDYLFSSQYCKLSKAELEKKILKFSQDRLFLDVANYVVIAIREELKQNWIQKFSNPADFSSKAIALKTLKSAKEFQQHASNVSQKVSANELKRRFDQCLTTMTGGQGKIAFGTGLWLSMIQGKKVLSQVISSGCFRVKMTDGTTLAGKEKINAVIKDLLKKPDTLLPEDFIKLRELMNQRLKI